MKLLFACFTLLIEITLQNVSDNISVKPLSRTINSCKSLNSFTEPANVLANKRGRSTSDTVGEKKFDISRTRKRTFHLKTFKQKVKIEAVGKYEICKHMEKVSR